jgi:hypothetical protein
VGESAIDEDVCDFDVEGEGVFGLCDFLALLEIL